MNFELNNFFSLVNLFASLLLFCVNVEITIIILMIMMKKSFKSHSGSYKLVVGGGELYKLEAVIKIERAGIWIIYSTMDGMTTIIIAKCVCMCVA